MTQGILWRQPSIIGQTLQIDCTWFFMYSKHMCFNEQFRVNALYQTSPGFTFLQYKSFENTVGKGGIARFEQYLLFPLCFLPVWRIFCHFHQIWNCRMQTFFHLEESKIWRFGKGWFFLSNYWIWHFSRFNVLYCCFCWFWSKRVSGSRRRWFKIRLHFLCSLILIYVIRKKPSNATLVVSVEEHEEYASEKHCGITRKYMVACHCVKLNLPFANIFDLENIKIVPSLSRPFV